MKKSIVSLMILSLVALTSCGGLPGVPGMPGAGATDVDPDKCGAYDADDAGKKLKAFLEATKAFQESVIATEAEIKVSCAAMATELGVSEEGDTKTVCTAVSDSIKEHLSLGLKAGAKLEIAFEPPTCTMNASAAASVAASCEGKASADIGVTCSGVCNGKCDGTCEGSSDSGGDCNSTCEGTCEGQCNGYADVEASLECEASAEVSASIEAECTEPTLDIQFEADMVVDAPKIEKVKAALMAGMPKLLQMSAKAKVPLLGAFKAWAKSAKGLADSGAKLMKDMGREMGMCVSGQLAGAGKMVGEIQASLDIQVEVSVSVSASASAEGSAGS